MKVIIRLDGYEIVTAETKKLAFEECCDIVEDKDPGAFVLEDISLKKIEFREFYYNGITSIPMWDIQYSMIGYVELDEKCLPDFDDYVFEVIKSCKLTEEYADMFEWKAIEIGGLRISRAWAVRGINGQFIPGTVYDDHDQFRKNTPKGAKALDGCRIENEPGLRSLKEFYEEPDIAYRDYLRKSSAA